jgi:hypothetical protein
MSAASLGLSSRCACDRRTLDVSAPRWAVCCERAGCPWCLVTWHWKTMIQAGSESSITSPTSQTHVPPAASFDGHTHDARAAPQSQHQAAPLLQCVIGHPTPHHFSSTSNPHKTWHVCFGGSQDDILSCWWREQQVQCPQPGRQAHSAGGWARVCGSRARGVAGRGRGPENSGDTMARARAAAVSDTLLALILHAQEIKELQSSASPDFIADALEVSWLLRSAPSARPRARVGSSGAWHARACSCVWPRRSTARPHPMRLCLVSLPPPRRRTSLSGILSSGARQTQSLRCVDGRTSPVRVSTVGTCRGAARTRDAAAVVTPARLLPSTHTRTHTHTHLNHCNATHATPTATPTRAACTTAASCCPPSTPSSRLPS